MLSGCDTTAPTAPCTRGLKFKPTVKRKRGGGGGGGGVGCVWRGELNKPNKGEKGERNGHLCTPAHPRAHFGFVRKANPKKRTSPQQENKGVEEARERGPDLRGFLG